jgi:NodT family efflux transporter outer membrane factor (OMF) lipoprotein
MELNPILFVPAMLVLLSSSCMVGPKYQRPATPAPPAYKEQAPASYGESKNWQQAQPNDGAIRGKWWEIYKDAELNSLEERVNISNQNVLAYEAQYKEARDVIRAARSNLFPTVGASPSITNSRSGRSSFASSGSGGVAVAGGSGTTTLYDLPVNLSWTADIWGSIRRTARADIAAAQATAAQLENARLSYQATLASDYFQLRGLDVHEDLLKKTVASYEEYLQLTRDRFDAGVASDADVAEAEAQLEGTRASLVDVGVDRAQYEHAIAILIGRPPAEFSIPKTMELAPPPRVPVAVPSTLLERRPDIAQYERQVAAANEQIGVAKAAYYPTVTLSASAGLTSTSIADWFTWPARFWSVGPTLSETLFDAGKRRAQLAEAQHTYGAAVANYRQTVLTAFQQVEDNLAALRILENEAAVEDRAVAAAVRSLDISTEQYKAGTVNYLNVLTAQATLLSDQISAISILTRRLTSSVLLVEALGGGWNATSLPTSDQIVKGQ